MAYGFSTTVAIAGLLRIEIEEAISVARTGMRDATREFYHWRLAVG